MSILTCKQCKETYNTSWGYHNDDYCTSSCHIESLEADNKRLVEALKCIAECGTTGEDARDMHVIAELVLKETGK